MCQFVSPIVGRFGKPTSARIWQPVWEQVRLAMSKAEGSKATPVCAAARVNRVIAAALAALAISSILQVFAGGAARADDPLCPANPSVKDLCATPPPKDNGC